MKVFRWRVFWINDWWIARSCQWTWLSFRYECVVLIEKTSSSWSIWLDWRLSIWRDRRVARRWVDFWHQRWWCWSRYKALINRSLSIDFDILKEVDTNNSKDRIIDCSVSEIWWRLDWRESFSCTNNNCLFEWSKTSDDDSCYRLQKLRRQVTIVSMIDLSKFVYLSNDDLNFFVNYLIVDCWLNKRRKRQLVSQVETDWECLSACSS